MPSALQQLLDNIVKEPLRRAWPYLGIVVAFLVFSPNIYWNATHNFVTYAYQLRHGLNFANPSASERNLPKPLPISAPPPSVVTETPPVDLSSIWDKIDEAKPLKGVRRFVSFLFSQLGFLGAFLIPLLAIFLRGGQRGRRLPPIVPASAIFPLVFFGTFSLLGAVEANWGLMYSFGACMWLAVRTRFSAQRLLILGMVNVGLFTCVVIHARWPFLPLPLRNDRALHETHGYEQLAKRYQEFKTRAQMAETYQLASIVNYYAGENVLQQYGGLTRDSELTRNSVFIRWNKEDIERMGGFVLLGHRETPQEFSGFLVNEHIEIEDCLQGNLRVKSSSELPLGTNCAVVQRWFETTYVRK